MHNKRLAGSGGANVAFDDRLRRPSSAGLIGAIPIFLIWLLSTTLLNPPIVGCHASPLVMRGSGPQQVKLIPIYYTEDELYPAGSGQAQLILGGRRFFHSSSQLRTHPLQPPLFLPVVQNAGTIDGLIDEKKQKRGPKNTESPTALTTAGIGEEGLTAAGVADQRLLRIERNPSPSSRELYQINTVGDMPVLRFGRKR